MYLLTLSSLLRYTALFSVTALFLPALINWLIVGGRGGRSGRIKIIVMSYMLSGMVFVAFVSYLEDDVMLRFRIGRGWLPEEDVKIRSLKFDCPVDMPLY